MALNPESTRHLPGVLAWPPLLLLMTQEHKAPNLNLRKACGISQSVAPVILSIHTDRRDMMSLEPPVGYQRSAPDAPDTSDEDNSQPERSKEDEAAGPKLDQAERQRNKKLTTMRQVEEMEQKEKAVKAGPCFTQLEGSIGNVNETVGEKRSFREACDAVAGEAAGQRLRGEGGGAGG